MFGKIYMTPTRSLVTEVFQNIYKIYNSINGMNEGQPNGEGQVWVKMLPKFKFDVDLLPCILDAQAIEYG